MDYSEIPTAAIVSVSNELLRGAKNDQNAPFLCRSLYELGIAVERIVVVPQDVYAISREIQQCSALYTHVFTTGGMGGTHDDVTMEGVGRAFNDKLVLNNQLLEALSKLSTENTQGTLKRMSTIPSSASLLYPKDSEREYPLLHVRNVVVLPGPPEVAKKKFEQFKELFRSSLPFHNVEILVNLSEGQLSEVVGQSADLFRSSVTISSYPENEKTRITLLAKDALALETARAHLNKSIPSEKIITGAKPLKLVKTNSSSNIGPALTSPISPLMLKRRNSVELHQTSDDQRPRLCDFARINADLTNFIQDNKYGFGKKVAEALDIIDEALERYS
jgi:FAD synthetase